MTGGGGGKCDNILTLSDYSTLPHLWEEGNQVRSEETLDFMARAGHGSLSVLISLLITILYYIFIFLNVFRHPRSAPSHHPQKCFKWDPNEAWIPFVPNGVQTRPLYASNQEMAPYLKKTVPRLNSKKSLGRSNSRKIPLPNQISKIHFPWLNPVLEKES